MVDAVASWSVFRERWRSSQNYLLKGEVFPFRYDPPPLARVVDEVRRNERARIITGRPTDRPEATGIETSTYLSFRNLPIEEAARAPVQLSHFELNEFTGPGQVFDGMGAIFDGWYALLRSHGFSWAGTQRAVFLSGPHSHTNYHFDSSYVLAWQVHGRKRFCYTKDPERWCGADVRRRFADRYDLMRRPTDLGPEDVIEVEMRPGDLLWNVMLTPHWVYSLDETAYSINLVHIGLRCDGQLSPMDRELESIRREREAAKGK